MQYPLHLSSQLREHLRALRKQRGLTQTQLGQLVGLSQARIAEIESNPGVVSVDQLMKVLSALRASLVLQDDSDAAPTGAVTTSPSKPKPVAQEPVISTKHIASEAIPVREAPPASRRNYVIRARKGSW